MIFSLAIKLTPFQWLSIFTLALLIVRELRMVNREPAQIRRKLAQSLVWITAAAAILAPDVVTRTAELVGIRRGADLVLYVVALAFMATSFYFYSRYLNLQRQITDLVRHLAIQEARTRYTEQI